MVMVINLDGKAYSSVEGFIKETCQNRNTILNLQDNEKTVDSLKLMKENLVNYLNMLNLLKSKINFGNDGYSLKIEFGWKDVLKGCYNYSYNVNLEYYSVLFNLAVCYNCLAVAISNKADDDITLKEAIKYYQFSAWLFDKIKNEVPTSIPVKEIQPDLSANYLTYVNYLNLVFFYLPSSCSKASPNYCRKKEFCI
jgi:hypothetical protein